MESDVSHRISFTTFMDFVTANGSSKITKVQAAFRGA
jgi:hypothetical protein